MKFGPLFIGWLRLSERERIAYELEPWPPGWEALHFEWNGSGFVLLARPRALNAL